jgi:hypothetical protein
MAPRPTTSEPTSPASKEQGVAPPQTGGSEGDRDPFSDAAEAHHKRIRAVVRGYSERQVELWQEFTRTIVGAQGAPPSRTVEEVIQAANEAYERGVQSSAEKAEEAIRKSLRQYVADLSSAWKTTDSAKVTPERLAGMAEQMWFIAGAAQGCYPAEWWNIAEPGGEAGASA